MTEPLDTLIHYRLERAQESLDEAHLLADAGRWNACVNRLYYSCFYAVSALLVRDGLSSSVVRWGSDEAMRESQVTGRGRP